MIDEAHKHQLESIEIAAILHGMLETQLKFIAEDEARVPRSAAIILKEVFDAQAILHVVEKAITSNVVNLTAFNAARRNLVALSEELKAAKARGME